MAFLVECPVCFGTEKQKNEKDICPACGGNRFVEEGKPEPHQAPHEITPPPEKHRLF